LDRVSLAFFLAPGCSSWFPGVLGAEVDNAQGGSWRRCFAAWLYLAAKTSHVGVDVDELAYPMHSPMTCSRQTSGQGLLQSVVLSHHSCGQWRLSSGCEAPRAWILGGILTAWVPMLPNLTWSKSFLPEDAYPLSEPSWCLGMYPWSSGDGMDSALEYMLSGACGFLWLRPIMPGA
jgi:hypothetical protein